MTLQLSPPPAPREANYDGPVQLLAARHPQVFRDLSEWVRLRPASTRVTGEALTPVLLSHGPFEIRLNCPESEPITAALRSLSAGRSLLHLFDGAAAFLQFLTQPTAAECLIDPAWMPILLLPLANAPHIQAWLLKADPAGWPWPLADRQNDTDATIARPAKLLAEALSQMAAHRTAVLTQSLRTQYTDRPTPAAVLREGARPLRVLALASVHSVYQQFCARDVAEGLEANGVEARSFVHGSGPLTSYQIIEKVRDFDPDVLLLNGSGRHGFPVPPELCILAWDQDYALSPSDEYAAKLGPRDLLMLMVADWTKDAALRQIPGDRVRHVNLGSNPRIYYPAATKTEPEYDILFVGNIHPFDTYRKIIGFDNLDPAVQKILLYARERLADWVRERGETEQFVLPDPDVFLRTCADEMGLAHSGDEKQWRFVVHYFRYRVAHLSLREQYLSALTEFRLGLFGRGWEQFPALASYARPAIENGPPLREAIHKAAINLHLHTWTVHHPRLYDTAAAGGFLLVGRVPEVHPLEKVFVTGAAAAEVEVFGSIPQLKKQIRHYLAHPEERQDIAARAAKRAARDHSMDARMREALKFLAEDRHDRA